MRPAPLTLSLLLLALLGCEYGTTDPATEADSDAGADAGPAPIDPGVLRVQRAPERSVSGDPGTSAPPPSTRGGWQQLDFVPHPRLGHAAVFDSANDRMVVFGGGSNDVWTLALSGESALVWRPLVVHGAQPPVHRYGTLATDSAVYDPVGERMIVCLNREPVTAATDEITELWSLALSGEPAWQKLAVLAAPNGAEVQGARAVYDPRGRRVLLFGGALERAGLWSLALDGEPVFNRIAGAPPQPGAFYSGHTLLLDAARNRVVLFGGIPRLQQLFALDLDGPGEWELLDPGNAATASYGGAAALDSERDRIVLINGDQQPGVTTFSLTDHTWTTTLPAGTPDTLANASVAYDAAREQLLLFGGSLVGEASNTTFALTLDTLAWSQLTDVADHPNSRAGFRQQIYDPLRAAFVSFGDYSASPGTFLRALDPLDGFGTSREPHDAARDWTQLRDIGPTPPVSFATAIYDPIGEAIVSFGGYAFRESAQLSQLGSEDGAVWQTIDAGAGPLERSGHVSVYDARGGRMIVFGGARNTSYPPRESFDDTWALALGENPSWTELRPEGTPPPAGVGALGIYDPEAERMLVYAGGVMHALSLGESPAWTRLFISGNAPGVIDSGSALYDPEGRRMILVQLDDPGVRVFALSLEDMIWHEYCWDTLTPAATIDFPETGGAAVLMPDGIFVTLANGEYRFDLATDYCE